MKTYYVYILATGRNGTIYIGITSDLLRRTSQHREAQIEGFTKRCKVKKLVYFQATNDVNAAIAREKQLKNWHCQWKINLIEQHNPNWDDLYPSLCGNINEPAV